MHNHRVVIVGGGIGGLTTALYLHKNGIKSDIYEAAGEFKELGVGLNLFPHAMQRLDELGLGPALAAVGIEPTPAGWPDRSPRGGASGARTRW